MLDVCHIRAQPSFQTLQPGERPYLWTGFEAKREPVYLCPLSGDSVRVAVDELRHLGVVPVLVLVTLGDLSALTTSPGFVPGVSQEVSRLSPAVGHGALLGLSVWTVEGAPFGQATFGYVSVHAAEEYDAAAVERLALVRAVQQFFHRDQFIAASDAIFGWW